MALIIVLLCVGLQRFLGWFHYGYKVQYLNGYFHWMIAKCSPVSKGHGLMGVLLLVLPALIVISLLFTLASFVLGEWSYYCLAALLLWFSIEARDLQKEPYQGVAAADLFVVTYERLFAILFWFVFFTLVGFAQGLVIYLILANLYPFLERRHQAAAITSKDTVNDNQKNELLTDIPEMPSLLSYTKMAHAIMDWVPVRLLGLIYALAGHFAKVFKSWLSYLTKPVSEDDRPLTEWGLCALDLSREQAESQSIEVINLIDRALIISLVLLLVLTVGIWIG